MPIWCFLAGRSYSAIGNELPYLFILRIRWRFRLPSFQAKHPGICGTSATEENCSSLTRIFLKVVICGKMWFPQPYMPIMPSELPIWIYRCICIGAPTKMPLPTGSPRSVWHPCGIKPIFWSIILSMSQIRIFRKRYGGCGSPSSTQS